MTTEDTVTIVLWRGQYRNDGIEVRDRPSAGWPMLKNVRLVGGPGCWFLIADAAPYKP